jgi:hypothetical protein
MLAAALHCLQLWGDERLHHKVLGQRLDLGRGFASGISAGAPPVAMALPRVSGSEEDEEQGLDI